MAHDAYDCTQYDCIECRYSPEELLPTYWDERTWTEGYAKGHSEGFEAGHYLGGKALCSDLLCHLHCWGIDYHLGLHGVLSPQEVLHEVVRLVEQLRGEHRGAGEGE